MYKKCLVLMCTYNGERYIKQQIDSIFNQRYCDINIIIYDDKSTDKTLEIINECKLEYGDRLSVIPNTENRGFANNFIDIIYDNKDRDFDFFALSDQDDFWKPEKVSKAIQLLDDSKPSLYCSSLLLVDKNLEPIKLFDHRFNRINQYNASIQNVCTGCTVVFNKKFTELLNKPKPQIYLHDYWLFLIAYYVGNFVYDENSYIMYRQHDNNQIGQTKKKKSIVKKIKAAIFEVFKRNIYSHINMLNQFIEYYGDEISDETLRILKFVTSKKVKNRLQICMSHKYRKFSKKENLYFKIRVLFGIN